MPVYQRVVYALGAALLALSVAGIPVAAAPANPGGPTPLPPVPQNDPFFGIVQAIQDPYHAVNAGARWERLVLWWSTFQPSSPTDWKPESWFARNLVEDERSRGIEPTAVVLSTPGWAARDPNYGPISVPKNLDLPFDSPDNYWGQFLTRLAREYAGLVDTFILGNEPDIYRETYANFAGSVDDFARMQMVGYQAIKAGNPKATVVLAGTTYWWDKENDRQQYLDRLLSALEKLPGAAENHDYFDVAAVHQYNSPLNIYTVTTLYRGILRNHGQSQPLWIDEANAVPYDDPLKPLIRGGLRASQEGQASYMIQAVALARAAGAQRLEIYKLRDEEPENDQYYGLVHNDGKERPAYIAYQVAVREMSNVSDAQYFWSGSAMPPTTEEITAVLSSSATRPQFVWPGALNGVRMRRGADRVTVLWNASAAALPVGIPSAAITATVIDKYGTAQAVARAADGAFHLTLKAAENNTDARDPSLVLVGGDPLIVVEPGQAGSRAAQPRPEDACWNVPGAQVPIGATPAEAWVAPTGYAVSGPWLDFFRSHGDVDYIGYPRSPVVADPLDSTQCIQYFQRVVLEWHPDNAPEYRIQRRLLATELNRQDAAPAEPSSQQNGADYWYFPKGDNGLGHAVTNIAPDGTRVGFKSYFDGHGKEDAFGYPMEPPVKRVGTDGVERWTQRFQAAIFEYHPENDKPGIKPGTGLPWRTWAVQLRLLGDTYLTARGLPFIAGDPADHVPVPPAPAPQG